MVNPMSLAHASGSIDQRSASGLRPRRLPPEQLLEFDLMLSTTMWAELRFSYSAHQFFAKQESNGRLAQRRRSRSEISLVVMTSPSGIAISIPLRIVAAQRPLIITWKIDLQSGVHHFINAIKIRGRHTATECLRLIDGLTFSDHVLKKKLNLAVRDQVV
jgi:hypothetical protein